MTKEICRDNKLCTGCTACANICPKKCISMQTNQDGFVYPVINEALCIDCGLCKKTCPVNFPPKSLSVKKGYVIRYRDPSIVSKSTSGGFCSALADYTFARDGILFGTGYDEDLKVRTFCISKKEADRVSEMIGSKYVQSDLRSSFSEVKRFLKEGRLVSFVGTPCQIAGLKSFLGRDYDQLLTVDLVCHGVSSPLLFEKYLHYQEEKYKSKPVDIRFRNKTYGYHSGTMMVCFANGKKYYGSGRIDYMLKAYFSGSCSRYSCYTCPYKDISRCSDLTIFDSWHIDKLVSGMKDDDKGYTNVFVHSDRGLQAIKQMDSSIRKWEADILQMEKQDGVMIKNNPKMSLARKKLIVETEKKGFKKAMQEYLPVTTKDLLLEKLKKILYITGVLRKVKKS